jgi:hypothetical protein
MDPAGFASEGPTGRDFRGGTVLEAVAEAGIKDIELWNLREHSLPPRQFFEAARKEILISAATAHATLHEFGDALATMAATGIRICFLLLHPVQGESELRRWSLRDDRHFKDMLSESRLTLRLVRDQRYHERFHFRFRNTLSPFTAVMIDGDADTIEAPEDSAGQLRMCPCSNYSFGSKGGLIIHLAKGPERSSAFDYYASDLRKQWVHEGKEDRDLFSSGSLSTP